jgi:hypothetical protein
MTSDERALLRHFRSLAAEQRHSLVDFAAFLAARSGRATAQPPAQPVDIPRPQTESVIKAVKRLTATYPMLDHGKLLHETSNFVGQHIMQGKPATEVIDELEVMFQRHYELFKGE